MADGRYRVYIRLTHNNTVAFRATNITVAPADAVKSGAGYKIKDKRIDLTLTQVVAKMELDILNLGPIIGTMSSKALLKMITSMQVQESPDFVAFAQKYIKRSFAGRQSTGKNYSLSVRRLAEFYKKDAISASEITSVSLQKFERWLREEQGVMNRGVNLYLTCIHRLFKEMRMAYNDYDNDIIVIRNNPFERYKIPGQGTPLRKKRTLTVEELTSIRDMPLQGKVAFARDMFMLSFYLVGMNSRDMYDCPAPVNGRIEYHRGKTKNRRSDQAFISIKIEPEAEAIINRYKGKKTLLDMRAFSSPQQLNYTLNKWLKKVQEGLFFYMARHTWASLARNKCGVSKDDVAMSLNHVDHALRTTDTYIETDWAIIDRANRLVLDYILRND